MGLFKSGDELVELGYSCIKQGDFSKALNSFEKAKEKLMREGSSQDINVIDVMTKLLRINFNIDNPTTYKEAESALKLLGDTEIKLGVNNVKSSDISNECMIKSQELISLSIPKTTSQYLEQRSKELQDVAMKYQTTIGNNILFIPEIFKKTHLTGISRGLNLYAESQENLAEATVWSDPKKAAEYYQNAANYRKQAGDLNKEVENQNKVRQYSKAVRCWICNREITGEDIHFFPMASDITPLQRKRQIQSPLPSKHETENVIYACRACHQAISKKADEIAIHYHNIAIEQMNRIQADLQKQINDLVKAINRIR
ncbi:MAG: hypothetical protein MUO82_01765 [Candidatus Thermoplasmatota archaeon]|nr:hypothetical protein [Candidatus Thermoplasmatota archaeon]